MRKTLNDIYEYDYISATSTGIFYPAMRNNHIFPEELRTPTMMSMLDFMYFSRSGGKYISTFIKSLDDKNYPKGEISNVVNRLVEAKYTTAWTRLFDTWNLEYDPIENYRMIEEMTDDTTETTYGKSHTRTDNLTHGRNLTQTRTPNLHSETNNNVYGFNSNTNVPTGKQIDTATGSETIGNTGNETDTGTVTDADTGKDTNVRNYELTRSGNIGVTTSQQMLESELNIWSVWDIFERVIFPDLDKILVLPIY